MVSSGRSCSTMAWSCLRRASDALSPSFAEEDKEEGVSSSTSSLSPSSSRWTAPFTTAKLSLWGEWQNTSDQPTRNHLRCNLMTIKIQHGFASTFSEVSLFFGGFHPKEKRTTPSRRLVNKGVTLQLSYITDVLVLLKVIFIFCKVGSVLNIPAKRNVSVWKKCETVLKYAILAIQKFYNRCNTLFTI